jgi:replicative DNA helicase
MTSGLQPGDLIIVAGRPSMGKTTLAVNIAENAALGSQKSAAIFSMEMSAESLTLRMLSSLGRIHQGHLRSGRLQEEDWPRIDSAMTQLSNASIHVDETPALTPTEVRARARRLKRERGLDLIVVDYLQLMQVAGTKENRATEISEISRSLKALAKELKVPVIALSQLNRGVEQRQDKKPVMSDLRECVTGDTLVCLADGRRMPIRDLVDQTPDVLSMTPDGRITRAKTEIVWRAGKKPIYELTLASGRKLRAIGRHRLYSSFGWQQVSDLGPGDRLALARGLPEPETVEKWPDDRVALLAHLIGDGSYLNQQPMRYSTGSEACSELVRRAAENEFGMRVKRYAGGANWHQLLLSGNGNRWHPAGINLWLRELGIFGQRSSEKRVPERVFRLGNEQIKLFLRHLWATDGSISTRKAGTRGSHGVHFSTCSRELARDVAALLLRIGIVGRIQTVTSGYKNPLYMVWIMGVEPQTLFLNTVGAFGPRVGPAEKLMAALVGKKANPNVDTLPEGMMYRVDFLMRHAGIGRIQMAEMRGRKNMNFDRCPSRALMAEYGQILNDEYLKQPAVSDIFWDRILKVDLMGEQDVFDLTVPETACWLADGIISHNSGALEQDADLILLIYREEVYDPNTTRKGIADIIIAKQRNGPTGDVQLTFLGQYTKFENYAPESYGEGVFR